MFGEFCYTLHVHGLLIFIYLSVHKFAVLDRISFPVLATILIPGMKCSKYHILQHSFSTLADFSTILTRKPTYVFKTYFITNIHNLRLLSRESRSDIWVVDNFVKTKIGFRIVQTLRTGATPVCVFFST